MTDDESYERRRNILLGLIKRTRWDDSEEKPKSKRGRKPKQIERPPSIEPENIVPRRKDHPSKIFF